MAAGAGTLTWLQDDYMFPANPHGLKQMVGEMPSIASPQENKEEHGQKKLQESTSQNPAIWLLLHCIQDSGLHD